MDDSTPTEPRARRVSLDSAYLDYINFARDEARTTFAYAHGNLINPQCNLQEHLDSGRIMSERSSTPDHESNAIDCETPAEIWESPPPQEQPSPSPSPSPFLSPSGADNAVWEPSNDPVEPYDNSVLGGAPGYWGFGTPQEPKEQWGPHDGKQYDMTTTEFIGHAWRYDVVTDHEVYRVSTIPDDFIGSNRANEWPATVKAEYDRYKAADNKFSEIDFNAPLAGHARYWSRDDIHKEEYDAALNAAVLRIQFMNKWPNAFDGHAGHQNHWYRPKFLLQKAEMYRRDGARVKKHWEETDEEPEFAGTGEPPAPDQSHVTNQSAVAPSVDNPLEDTPDYRDTPLDVAATLGKRVYALSPQQYEEMRKTNDQLKAALRDKVMHNNDYDEGSYIYTITRRPEACYPNLPELKPDLQNRYGPLHPDMECTDYTLKRLAGYWYENNRC